MFGKSQPILTFYLNIFFHLALFLLFLVFFGIPSIEKYLAKETIFTFSEEETGGIEPPAVTFVALKASGSNAVVGWKTSHDIKNYQKFSMVDHCENISLTDLETCVSNDTFGLDEFLKEANLGFLDDRTGLSAASSLWSEDLAATFLGRYFTLKPPRTLTRNDSDAIVFRMDTTSSLTFWILLHDHNYFLLNINPFSQPARMLMVNGNSMNGSGYYHDITLTHHKRLNLDRRPCEEDLGYNFTICVKENLSEKVGCRLPWDKLSRQDRPVCSDPEQFSRFEEVYLALVNTDAEQIVKTTGCKKPCQYKEYKWVESSPKVIPRPSVVMFSAASSKTQIEEEVLLYPFTSLVAEFGGYLGLFCGFSFLTIWHQIKRYFCK